MLNEVHPWVRAAIRGIMPCLIALHASGEDVYSTGSEPRTACESMEALVAVQAVAYVRSLKAVLQQLPASSLP